ncbi:DinB family protein [Kribbella hippodromi]|uniref:DinB family protein n=1 Tax=Kribbella hippodromi TaxID=434347 RepID=A0ABP4NTV7_9ACTN
MIDDFAKEYLHDELRWIREALLSKLEGLSEYDVRRPLTTTGTNLLGLVKHLSVTEARYFSEVFDRPSPWPLPHWKSDDAWSGNDMWAAEHETRTDIVDRYRLARDVADATIAALPIDAPGHVPWWPRPDVKLFNIMVHLLAETSRHAGHADILREELDGRVGAGLVGTMLHGRDRQYWVAHRAKIERAAQAHNEPDA